MYQEPRTKADLLGDTANVPGIHTRMLARSTVQITYPDSTRTIRYHDTDVLTFQPNGWIVLNSGGYRTSTTKARINEYQRIASVFQDKGHWYCKTERGVFDFYDGIIFLPDGCLQSAKRDLAPRRKEIAKLKRKISALVAQIDQFEKLPLPDEGDCWACLFRWENRDCLLSHVNEGYLHGSLIRNALRDRGYSEPNFLISTNAKDLIKRALRKFLIKNLITDVATN